METPREYEPILAIVSHVTDTGIINWFEVVYYCSGWKSYAGSKTFDDGETVRKWEYCNDIM